LALIQDKYDLEQLRMMAKVSHLYHERGMVQAEISQTLGLSQTRVSRLLSAAAEANIIRTVVVPPIGLNTEIEDQIEKKFGMLEVHVVDTVGGTDGESAETLGRTLGNIFTILPLKDKVIGLTSWSRSMRKFIGSLNRFPHAKAEAVVELVGGVGEPALQHEANSATARLATVIDAEAKFLRVPGVVSSIEMKDAILQSDPHARVTLEAMDNMDIALVGIGNCAFRSGRVSEGNFFSQEQFDLAKSKGAVGEVNLRFIDKDGKPIKSELDDLVIGISLEQLSKVERRIAVSSGADKHEITLAAMRGGWINVLITDEETAEYLLSQSA
jgi:DNA-binding transcriptional regulator LsrR (DeoR family)